VQYGSLQRKPVAPIVDKDKRNSKSTGFFSRLGLRFGSARSNSPLPDEPVVDKNASKTNKIEMHMHNSIHSTEDKHQQRARLAYEDERRRIEEQTAKLLGQQQKQRPLTSGGSTRAHSTSRNDAAPGNASPQFSRRYNGGQAPPPVPPHQGIGNPRMPPPYAMYAGGGGGGKPRLPPDYRDYYAAQRTQMVSEVCDILCTNPPS
jgi:hypothetical protein